MKTGYISQTLEATAVQATVVWALKAHDGFAPTHGDWEPDCHPQKRLVRRDGKLAPNSLTLQAPVTSLPAHPCLVAPLPGTARLSQLIKLPRCESRGWGRLRPPPRVVSESPLA